MSNEFSCCSYDEKKEDLPIMEDPPEQSYQMSYNSTNEKDDSLSTQPNTTTTTPASAAATTTTASSSSSFISPSKRRAMAASSAGLSELSKQLRILQAKNEGQAVEINRLERQLRILAELQGISVADLRKALEDACANEAFGELQHRVAKLRAELEAATLAKQKELRSDASSSAPHIANLELRVGELEEVEEKHQAEIHHLYEQLRHERARATRLEAEGAQHKKDAQEYLEKLNKERAKAAKLEAAFQEQLQKYQMEQAQKMQELAKLAKDAQLQANRNKNGMDADGTNGNGMGPHGAGGHYGLGTNGHGFGTNGGDGTGTKGMDANGMGTRGSFANAANGTDAAALASLGRNDHDEGANPFDLHNGNAGGSGNDPTAGSLASITPQLLAQQERLLKMLKEKEDALRAAKEELQAEKDKWLKRSKEAETAAREAQMNLQVEKDKAALTIRELTDNDSQNELRLAQFRARFNVQDERIKDMEQQLSSLYTAFGLLKEDRDAEELHRVALENNLNEADEEMAKQVYDEENKQGRSPQISSPQRRDSRQPPIADPWDTVPRSTSSNNVTPSVPQTITTPASSTAATAAWNSPTRSSVATPAWSSPARSSTSTPAWRSPSRSTPATDNPTQSVSAHAVATPSRRTSNTWQLIFPEPHTTSTRTYSSPNRPGQDNLMIKGMLIVKSRSMVRKWKPKHCKLYLSGNHYQWDMEGKSFILGFGISKVEYYPNHPLAFTVYTNPYDEMAPVIHAAASTERDYHRWMAALTKATTGGEYEVPRTESDPRQLERTQSYRSSFNQHSSADSVLSGISVEEQEAADLERALRISQTIT